MLSPVSASTLGFLEEIYRLQGMEPLTGAILSGLPRLIPCDNVMIGHHDGTCRALHSIALRHPFTRANFLIEAARTGHIASHPFWEFLLDERYPIKILSETAPGRHWLDNPLYREILREDRVRDQLSIEFGSSIADFTSVSVIRSIVGFHQSERDILLLLRPHLEQAFANARLIDPALLANHHTTAIPVTPQGAWGEPGSREKILALLGSTTHQHARFAHWLADSIAKLNCGASTTAPLHIHHRTHTSSFHLQRDWLNRCYRLLHRQAASACELSAQPLSKKEHEILFWIAEGKSNPEIASLLAISPETVKTHLKHIFRKLGVESRTAAANHARQTSNPHPSA